MNDTIEARTTDLFDHLLDRIKAGIVREPELIDICLLRELAALIGTHMAVTTDIVLANACAGISDQEMSVLRQLKKALERAVRLKACVACVGDDRPSTFDTNTEAKGRTSTEAVIDRVRRDREDTITHGACFRRSVTDLERHDLRIEVVPELPVHFRVLDLHHLVEARDLAGSNMEG